MIIIDLFDIDIHIFTVIKFLFNLVVKFKYLFNLVVRFKYIYLHKISSTIKKINLRFAYTFITFGINIHVVYIVTSNTYGKFVAYEINIHTYL